MRIPIPTQQLEMSPDEVRYWKGRIKASIKRRKEEFIQRIGYDTLVRYFEGLQCAELAKFDQMAVVDEFSPAIASIIRTTYYQNPSFVAEPLHPDAEKMIQPPLLYLIQNPDFQPFTITELFTPALKHAMRKAGMKEEMQLADFDLLVAGFTCVEVNHTKAQQTEAPAPEADVAPKDNNIIDSVVGGIRSTFENIKSKLSSKTEQEVDDEVAQYTPSDRTDSTDATYIKRWNPLEILFDDRATVWKESGWAGKEIKKTLAEFNRDYPKFKGRIQPGSDLVSDMAYSSHMKDPENKKSVTLYEIEIKKQGPRNCVLVLCNGIDEAIDYYERPIVSNNFSIKYQSIDKYGKIYPMSRARKAKKPQDDINHYMTIQFEHVDRAMRKIAAFYGGLTEGGKTAMNSSDPYAIVEKSIPGPVFEAMPAPSVVPENKEIVLVMRDAINKAFGTNELAKTGESENDLLGQDQLQAQSFEVNVSAVQDALQDLADELLDGLKDIIMQLWDGEDYFKISGLKGGDQWYTPEMGPLADLLIGDWQLKTDIVSAMRPNPAKDTQNNIALAEFLTKPEIQAYMQARGKMTTMAPIDNVVKSFNQNPELIYEDIKDPLMMAPGPGQPMPGEMPQEGQKPIPVPQQPMEEPKADAVL
jgi:hypothetical protein